MRKFIFAVVMAGCVLVACRVEIEESSTDQFRHSVASAQLPWTHEKFDSSKENFTFAIFTDLYGGYREGIFETAVAQLNLLRPEIILSVGDLIDGGTEDREELQRQWDEFDSMSGETIAPVFYVGGNHDLTNVVMRDVWEQRYGRRYYDFVYKDVLFIVLDTEDNTPDRMQEIYEARAISIEIIEGRAPGTQEETEYFKMSERRFGKIGDKQIAAVGDALARFPDVRWTFLFMHKPAWLSAENTGFSEIETLLGERSYTVFNGHFHNYAHETRNGRDYIMLGTTGGSQVARSDMSFDHITLVTMTDDRPSIGNLKVDGILDKTGHIPLHEQGRCYQASRCDPE